MSVLSMKEYKQKNGDNILKVILNPTEQFPDGGYFYCDIVDENLVKRNTWRLHEQRHPYITSKYRDNKKVRTILFHQEKAYSILGYYPEYINHINRVEFDNIDKNLDVVSNQQNVCCTYSRGYSVARKNFQPHIKTNQKLIHAPCVKSEPEACLSAYQLELYYEDYRYDFLRDRINDLDILDKERTGLISEEEAIYCHVTRYALDNAWYYFRYNLADYFKEYHLKIPSYSLDNCGFMVDRITGKKLCPSW